MNPLDLLFPKRCIGCRRLGSYLCPNCFATISFSTSYVCFACNKASLDGLTHPICRKPQMIDGVVSSLNYAGLVKRLVYQFKYQPYLTDLKPILTDLFYEGIIQHELLTRQLSNAPLITTIPLHASKLRKRGYNQAEILAKGLAVQLHLEFRQLLQRQRLTTSQFKLNREQRKANIQDAFKLKDGLDVLYKNRTILLVDDVVTSGSTLIEAAKVLKRSGADKVFGVTLAHGV